MIPVGATLRIILLLIVGIEILLGIIHISLTNFVESLFVEQERSFIVGGKFIQLGHGQRIHGAGLHTGHTSGARPEHIGV